MRRFGRLLLLLPACADDPSRHAIRSEAGASSEAGLISGTHDARVAADADVAVDSIPADGGILAPYTMRGVYRCCAPDAGLSCCGGLAQGLCFSYGGLYGGCVPEGGDMDGKVLCGVCCPGLARVGLLIPGEADSPSIDGLPEGCDQGPIGAFICVACGDGVCGMGETFCNCPPDCTRQ